MSTLDSAVVDLSRSGVEMELVSFKLDNMQDRLDVLQHTLTMGDVLVSGSYKTVVERLWLWLVGNGASLVHADSARDLLRLANKQIERAQSDLSAGISVLFAQRDELNAFRNGLADINSNCSVTRNSVFGLGRICEGLPRNV